MFIKHWVKKNFFVKFIFLIVFSLIQLKGFSQKTIYVDIQKNKKTYPQTIYNFDKVIDNRINKDNLGIIFKSDLRNEYPANFEESLAIEFFSFLRNTFTNNQPQYNIIMVVNYFEIGHVITGRKNDTGFVNFNFDFYRLKNDSTFLVCNSQSKLIDYGENIANSHSNRIKRSILIGVAKLDSVLKTNSTLNYSTIQKNKITKFDSINNGVVRRDSITNKAIEAKTIKKEPDLQNLFMLGGRSIFAFNTIMYGGEFSFLANLRKHPKIFLGINVNYSIINFDNTSFSSNIIEYKIRSTDLGLKMLKNIKYNFYYNFNPHLMIGKETITKVNSYQLQSLNNGYYLQTAKTSKEDLLFLGFQLDNGIYYLVKPVYFGIDFIIRLTSSDIFDDDVGVKLNFGFTF